MFKRTLVVVLLVIFAASLLATAFVAINPSQSNATYSEFYLLGPDGKAKDYPTKLKPSESGTVTVGVTNHEGEATDYEVQIVDLNATEEDGPLRETSQIVAHRETWESNVTFSIEDPGLHHVQFQLYKDTTSRKPYLTTRLWVNVTTAEPTTSKELSGPKRFTEGIMS